MLNCTYDIDDVTLLVLGPNTYNENETIAKYEIMDGAPVRGELCWFEYLLLIKKVQMVRCFSEKKCG